MTVSLSAGTPGWISPLSLNVLGKTTLAATSLSSDSESLACSQERCKSFASCFIKRPSFSSATLSLSRAESGGKAWCCGSSEAIPALVDWPSLGCYCKQSPSPSGCNQGNLWARHWDPLLNSALLPGGHCSPLPHPLGPGGNKAGQGTWAGRGIAREGTLSVTVELLPNGPSHSYPATR